MNFNTLGSVSKTGTFSASNFSAGMGIEGIESRIREIEGRLETIRKMNGEAPPAQSFASFLDAPPAPAAPSGTLQGRASVFKPVIEELSEKYGVDHSLVKAVVRQESGFNPNAVSHAGAEGLMQLMPGTAKGLGVTNSKDPVQNLDGGIRHLKNLLTHYHGNIPLALAAYNAGMGAVKKHGGIPPYKETQNYVKSILSQYLREKNADS